MNESFVMNNDVIYLESKIPKFKVSNLKEIMHETLRNYHLQGSDKDDTNYLVNIHQSNTQKINLDESNFGDFVESKIFIFLHKKTKDDFKNSNNGRKKDISNAQNTQVIKETDEIIGYSTLEMKKIFLSDDFKFQGKVNLIQKKKTDKNPEKKSVSKNKKAKVKAKNTDNKFNEKGERVIGNI